MSDEDRANVVRNELGQVMPAEGERKFAGTSVPNKVGCAGVKERERGANKGKFQAFLRTKDGDVYTGEYRDTREQAAMDLIVVKARVYT